MRYASTGTAFGNFRLAVSKRGDSDAVSFFTVKTFGTLAETCTKYLTKGRLVIIEGRLEEDTWETEGQRKSRVVIVASRVEFVDNVERGGTPNYSRVMGG